MAPRSFVIRIPISTHCGTSTTPGVGWQRAAVSHPFGRHRGWATKTLIDQKDFLPSTGEIRSCPKSLAVDVIVPVYRGLEETKRCLQSVLNDPTRPPGRVIVVDDASPEPALTAWLDQLRASNHIVLLRSQKNQGFVTAANAGIAAALDVDHDVALLNSDTEVPVGWLARLAGHAYAEDRIATVSPLSNNATICEFRRSIPATSKLASPSNSYL